MTGCRKFVAGGSLFVGEGDLVAVHDSLAGVESLACFARYPLQQSAQQHHLYKERGGRGLKVEGHASPGSGKRCSVVVSLKLWPI